MVKIYLARSMTGRVKEDIVAEAKEDKAFFEAAGLTVLCPVISENVDPTKQVLRSSKKQMDIYWRRDKAMIREAHAVIDMTPGMKSEGVAHELGYARYSLWKPILRVYPPGKLPMQSCVAFYEDDCIVDSRIEAVEYLIRVHGSFIKRLKWRLKLINRCLPKWILWQLMEIK